VVGNKAWQALAKAVVSQFVEAEDPFSSMQLIMPLAEKT